MEKPTCKTCPYWGDSGPSKRGGRDGFCHRRPPRVDVGVAERLDFADDPTRGWWPSTEDDDFCGEHPDFPAFLASLKGAGDGYECRRYPLDLLAILSDHAAEVVVGFARDISPDDLAARLGVSKHRLRQILNDAYDKMDRAIRPI